MTETSGSSRIGVPFLPRATLWLGTFPRVQNYCAESALLLREFGDAQDFAERIAYVFSHLGEDVMKRSERVYLMHRWSGEGPRLVSRGTEFLTR